MLSMLILTLSPTYTQRFSLSPPLSLPLSLSDCAVCLSCSQLHCVPCAVGTSKAVLTGTELVQSVVE